MDTFMIFLLMLLPIIITVNLDIDSFFCQIVVFIVLFVAEILIILRIMFLKDSYISNKISKKNSSIDLLKDEKNKIKEDICKLQSVEMQISETDDPTLLKLFELCMSRKEYELYFGKATVEKEQRINSAIQRIVFNDSSIVRDINEKNDIKLKVCSLNKKMKEIDSKIEILLKGIRVLESLLR